MKILISTCHFTPDPIGVGKFSGEMAEWLAARGHEVRAVVAVPFYPHWRIAPGYSTTRYKRERIRGVDVLRCPIWIPRRQSGLARMLQYGILAITSAPLQWWALRWKPHIVWTVMPPFSGMPGALLAARLAGARSWLHVQDVEIDAAFELGLLNANWLKRLFLSAERRLMSAFNVVSAITLPMLRRLDAKGVERAETLLFPNWVDLDVIYPRADSSEIRAELQISQDAFVVLYSGNLGEKQGVDGLIDVARDLRDVANLLVVICGDGGGRGRLSALAGDLPNIRFLPLQPMEKFNAFLGMASVHLLPQKAEVADLVMPSKLPAMLASGRPVIAGAAPQTELAREVENCGLIVTPGDAKAMADAVRVLHASPQLRATLGQNAAKQARDRWGKSPILERFEQQLVALAAGGPARTRPS